MNTYRQLLNQSSVVQAGLLPTRQQLEKFLQLKGLPAKRLGQMSTWEQIRLTHEYQTYAAQQAE